MLFMLGFSTKYILSLKMTYQFIYLFNFFCKIFKLTSVIRLNTGEAHKLG